MMSSQAALAALNVGRWTIVAADRTLSRARSTASESKKWRDESLNRGAPISVAGEITVSGLYFGPTVHAAAPAAAIRSNRRIRRAPAWRRASAPSRLALRRGRE